MQGKSAEFQASKQAIIKAKAIIEWRTFNSIYTHLFEVREPLLCLAAGLEINLSSRPEGPYRGCLSRFVY